MPKAYTNAAVRREAKTRTATSRTQFTQGT